ncbi:MAG TPA: thiol-disulfide isomerase [Bryobacteraceae bacterium]|nr:thiol-disulfide isomerase [Bryobacteraceae bacterium]
MGLGLPVLASAVPPTFSKDVAPILYNRCLECHRQGEAAPMAFTSYNEVRPWAKAIKQAVLTRKMPPWLADPHFGEFRNDRRMPDAAIQTIVAWVDAGAPEGDPKQLPAMPPFETGWRIGKPDAIFDIGTDFDVPSEGVVAYKYFTVPTNFTEDKWVEAAEVRPGQRGAVHHILAFIKEPGNDAPRPGDAGNILVGYAPGENPLKLMPGTAVLVKAGSSLNFQVHYTPNGKAVKDRSYIGVRFAKEPPKNRAIRGMALNAGFRIPANDSNYEVRSSYTANQDVTLDDLTPHMHLRGKDFQYTLVYPDGRQDVILSVPKYDFNWQIKYQLKSPMLLPKGTKIDCVAHFDNSPNNKFNPDPAKEVRWGEQTWEEMMIGFFTYTVPYAPTSTAAVETGSHALEVKP